MAVLQSALADLQTKTQKNPRTTGAEVTVWFLQGPYVGIVSSEGRAACHVVNAVAPPW